MVLIYFLSMKIRPNVLGERGEGPADVEEGESHRDHVDLVHGTRARARNIRLGRGFYLFTFREAAKKFLR